MDVDLSFQRALDQIALAFMHLGELERLNRAVGDAQLAVGNRPIQIDANGPAKPSASRTCAYRIVEREKAGRGWADVEIAVWTMPALGKAMFVHWFEADDHDPPLAEAKRLFDRFNQARTVSAEICNRS